VQKKSRQQLIKKPPLQRKTNMNSSTPNSTVTPKRIFGLGILAVVLVVAFFASFSVFEVLDADKVMFIQYPTGTITYFTEQGPHFQLFGSVTMLPRRGQFWFSAHLDQGEEADQSIKIRFNDAAHAKLSGSLSYELPVGDEQAMLKLYRNYRNIENIESQLIRTVTEKSVYMTGPLMSSQESYSSKRNQLLGFVDDQIVGGVYKTFVRVIRDKDPMTGGDRTVNVTEIMTDPKTGLALRQDESPVASYKIKISNLSLNEVRYDTEVEKQIAEQQKAIQQVQLAIAQAKEAEQQAITTAKRGEASAAEAKWKQEALKAQAVTLAQQELEVAMLETKKAVQYKAKKILEAEAEYEYKRKIILGDGALTQKLATYQAVMEKFAEAIGRQKWVPDVVFENGAGGRNNGSSATALIDMLSVKTAKDLALDLSVPKK